MRNDRVYLSGCAVVFVLGLLVLSGCTQGATPATSSPTEKAGSQSAPPINSAPIADTSSLSNALNATADSALDPLAALDLPPAESSDIEFVTVYMEGGRKFSFANFPNFGEGYLDEDGYLWSKNLRKTVNGTYPEAVNACAAVGAVLPSGAGGIPTLSMDGKSELVPGLSKTEIPMQTFFYDYTHYQTYVGATRTTKYASTNSKDVLCVMKYKGRRN